MSETSVSTRFGDRLLARVRDSLALLRLPVAAHIERRRDQRGLPAEDPGSERVMAATMEWLAQAQDRSASRDGGVSRSYSLVTGWASSYPETTGYILPTFIDYARRTGRADMRERARRMADWLVQIQLPCGGFQGGKIDSTPVVPVTFNTGQILLGLAAAEVEFGDYGMAMRRAADWLVATQDADGCWRRYRSPFASAGEKEYETHTAWGLFEAARIDPARGYAEAALRNVRWASSSLRPNGWFSKCCLDQPAQPLTHTIAYALRGVLEAHRYSSDPALLEAAKLTADGLMGALRPDGALPGRLDANWSPAVDWVCLTGNAQTAHCWLMLHLLTGRTDYLEAARKANRFVRCTVRVDGPPEIRGGVKGSFPVSGAYGRYEYLNWGAKFLVDSLMLEMAVVGASVSEPRLNGYAADQLKSWRPTGNERIRLPMAR